MPSPPKTPSPSIRAALLDAASPRRLDPWSYGSATISKLKKAAAIAPVKLDRKTWYEITEIGRALLHVL
jgi:predicted oxidoreductase